MRALKFLSLFVFLTVLNAVGLYTSVSKNNHFTPKRRSVGPASLHSDRKMNDCSTGGYFSNFICDVLKNNDDGPSLLTMEVK